MKPVFTNVFLLSILSVSQIISAETDPAFMPPCGIVENPCCIARGSQCAKGGVVELDFLYWTAENDGFVFAFDRVSGTIPGGNYENRIGRMMRLSDQWDPGFRVGLGINSDHDQWDYLLNWTWIRKNCTQEFVSNIPIPPNKTQANGYFPVISFLEYSFHQVTSQWKLLHNLFNFECGRAFYITPALSLRLHGGLGGGWINQNFSSNFAGQMKGINPDPNLFLISTYNVLQKNNFWGVGPRVGIHGVWHLAKSDWSIVSQAATALFYGQTTTELLSEFEEVGTGLMQPYSHISDECNQLVSQIQLFLGVHYGKSFHNEKYFIGSAIGWEENIFFDQFKLPYCSTDAVMSPIPGSSHALTLEGMTWNVHFDF